MSALRKRGLALSVLMLAAAHGRPARCDEWYLESQVQTQMVTNDNAQLDRQGGQDVVGAILSPRLHFGRRSEALDLSLMGGPDFNGYVVNSQLSSIDGQLDFHGAYQKSERSTLTLDSGFKQDTIIENPEDTSGRNHGSTYVTTLSARPSWSYRLTELDSLGLSAGYLDSAYSGGSSNGYTDYSFYSASGNWYHRLTETDSFTAQVSYGHYDPQGVGTDSADIYSLQLGWAHDFSEILQLHASAGPSLRHSHGPSSDSSGTDFGANASVGLTYQPSKISTLQVNFTHQNEPTSNGAVQLRDRVQFSAFYQLDELTALTFSGSFVENEDGGGTGSKDFDRYYSLVPGVSWRLRENLDLGLSYRFQDKTYSNPSDQAMSNAVFLTLTWRAPRLSWSD